MAFRYFNMKRKFDKDDFYVLMGDIFSYRKYRKELPYLYNSDDKTWILGFKEDKLIGFVSLEVIKDICYFSNDFVFPEYRGKGCYNRLFEKRMGYVRSFSDLIKYIEVTANKNTFRQYEKYGFEFIKDRGQYKVYRYYFKKREK